MVFLVWIVSNEQLLAWVRNPVPVSQLDSVAALKCSTPQVDSTLKICNGIPQNENGLLDSCDFSDFPFFTCVRIDVSCRWISWTMTTDALCEPLAFSTVARFRLPLLINLIHLKQPGPTDNFVTAVSISIFGRSQVLFCSTLNVFFYVVPANCSTPFWDPIGNKCLCTSSTCQFTDNSRPIGVSALCTCAFKCRIPLTILSPTFPCSCASA